MSIYLTARLQQAQRKRANAFKRTCALFSFAATTAAVLMVWPQNINTELRVTTADIAAPEPAVPAQPMGYAAMFNQDIFNVKDDESVFVSPTGPTALDIAQSFTKVRFALAEAKVEVPKVLAVDRFQVAAISPSKKPRERNDSTLSVVSQPMPNVAALDAIDALSSQGSLVAPRDPSLPYPLEVPTTLAYARDNAPSLKDFVPSLTQASMNANKKQHWCLATAIYFEARGESYRGQVAVAQVVRNRVKHKNYPNSLCAVVFQNQSWRNRCQFSFACDGIPERVNEKKAWKQAEEIATKVINGDIYLANVSNATHYHANYVRPKWAPKLKRLTQVGVHIFYRFKTGWTAG